MHKDSLCSLQRTWCASLIQTSWWCMGKKFLFIVWIIYNT